MRVSIRTMSVILAGVVLGGAAYGAAAKSTKTSKQSAIQSGTTVRTRVTATGLYDQECYDAYYACMDQFCIPDNTNGGSCACSDDSIEFERQFNEIRDTLAEAERIQTVEVEKVKAGAQADIIFTGRREYDENGNVKSVDELQNAGSKDRQKQAMLSLWDDTLYSDSDDVFESADIVDIAGKSGSDLYVAADRLCTDQVPASCDKDLQFLRQVYSRQIVSDCKAFENSLTAKRNEAKNAMAEAEAAVRAAQKEIFDDANKYKLGDCITELKKCMQTEDACGTDWENCVSTIASENMQNNQSNSTAGTKVKTTVTYDITASTMEMLESKRTICENVLDHCVAVRDQVWPAFLRAAAPTIRFAEQKVESKFRKSCLTNISNCIHTACMDDIAGKGVATMDACLSRPDMARSFCKVEIDPCERMEPLIWGYVTDKLAAMRVDACTQEVKDCFTADTRCGADFSNCIGMDYAYMHDICPLDSLVVCKANNPNFSMDDLDDMLMGLYLNVDNAAYENCQNLVDKEMTEICGSTTDCNRFAADEFIGTGSLRSQKNGTVYSITGMITFKNLRIGQLTPTTDDGVKLAPGEIGVADYLAEIKKRHEGKVANFDAIYSVIEEELNNIARNINRTIELISMDPQIQYCINGRDLSQITGKAGKTAARFPNLLNQVKMQIAMAAVQKATENYNSKYNELVAKATHDKNADVAEYMCHKIAENSSRISSGVVDEDTTQESYAIIYDVGTGLTTADLTKGGKEHYEATFNSHNGSSMTKDVTAIFTRETRNCHVCTTVTTSDCTVKGGNWFRTKSTDCKVNNQEPKCEDIVM